MEEESYHIKLFKTLLLCILFFVTGTTNGAVNNGMPDLIEVYGSSAGTLNVVYAVNAFARIVMTAACGSGYFRMGSNVFLTFFFMLLLLGAVLILYPFSAHVLLVYVLAFLMGIANAVLYIGANAECLRIWRGQNSDPYMHSMHMGEALGYLFAPALATQVLSSKVGEAGWEPLPGLDGVKAYFPILGVMTLALSTIFLGFVGLRRPHESRTDQEEELRSAKADSTLSRAQLSVAAVFGLIQLLMGTSWLVGQQIPLYAANSHLRLSRADGASLNLLYRICFVAARILGVLLSLKMRATKTIYLFLALYALPCIFILWRQTDLTLSELEASVAVLGVGSGPLHSTTLLIFEDIMPLTARITSLVYLGQVIGIKLFPVLVGLFIQDHPSTLFVAGVITGLTSALYAMLSVFKMKIKEQLQ